MDITNLTWEDIARLLIEQGLWGIVVVAFVIGLVLGWFFTRLYYDKLHNIKMENDLAAAEKALEETNHKLKECQERYSALKEETDSITDIIYARGALNSGACAKPDVLASLREVHTVTTSDKGKSGEKIETAN